MNPPKCRSCGVEEWRHICRRKPKKDRKGRGVHPAPTLPKTPKAPQP